MFTVGSEPNHLNSDEDGENGRKGEGSGEPSHDEEAREAHDDERALSSCLGLPAAAARHLIGQSASPARLLDEDGIVRSLRSRSLRP
jgi:hypothetical protein